MKNPFYKIKQDYVFKNYEELDEFFESVKNFTKLQEKFLQSVGLNNKVEISLMFAFQ